MKTSPRIPIFVSLDLGSPELCGTLWSETLRAKDIFSFEYEEAWLTRTGAMPLDPGLQLFRGSQYTQASNFGIFLDSTPDRWGRFLIRRREALKAREEGRPAQNLRETDFLLGVHDAYRMGALRFQTDRLGPFLDDDSRLAAPPWASLRELEFASLEIEKSDASENAEYAKWLRMLLAPGGSLGGARPKASVIDEKGALWIAKFPGSLDTHDMGAWEMLVHDLALKCGLNVPIAHAETLTTSYHTFLVKRFDRDTDGKRIFFMSAMTALERRDGDDASSGASYLEIAEHFRWKSGEAQKRIEEIQAVVAEWRQVAKSFALPRQEIESMARAFRLAHCSF